MLGDTDVDFRIAFLQHGVALVKSGSSQYMGDCPFCGKEKHFFVDDKTGRWDCKTCMESGNLYTFLRKSAAKYSKQTSTGKYVTLSVHRSIPHGQLKGDGWYWNELADCWMLPVVNRERKIIDIRIYDGKSCRSTKNCSTHLLGEMDLVGKDAKPGKRVWLCEGEWDRGALRALLKKVGSDDIVVAVPGAGVFKKEWAALFSRKTVVLAYDNDEPGQKGAMRALGFIKPYAEKVQIIQWPEGKPKGYDIRDFCKRWYIHKEAGIKIFKELLGLLENRIEKKDEFGKVTEVRLNSDEDEFREIKPPITFSELIEIFKLWVRVDQALVDSLAVCLAVSMGNEVPGDPLWLYFVAPPGSGKTLILMTMQTSHRNVFRSTLTPASLVSGFNASPDPSLLPQLDRKTAIFKDGTELLAMNPDAKRETYGVLRGAFDGQVSKSFGNGITREYNNLHFNMIVGMTPAIHGDSQATMGERFLKYEMREDRAAVESKIRAAIGNISKEDAMMEQLCDGVERFLNRPLSLEEMPKLPEDMIDHIVALAQILSALRAQVDRELYGDRDMRYRPVHEVGTRIAKQLSKLAMMLAAVYGKREVDWVEYRLIQKVALDTSIGFHLDILAALVRHQSKELTKEAIAYVTNMPTQTVIRRIMDMEQLGLVSRSRMEGFRGTGLAPIIYKATPLMINLWGRASIDWTFIRLRKFPDHKALSSRK